MKYLVPALCSAALLTSHIPPASAQEEDEHPPIIQYFLGTLKLEDQSANWTELSDEPVQVDFNAMPSVGIEAEYAFHQGWVHWGLNSGGSVAYKDGDTNFNGMRTRNAAPERTGLDNSLLLVEVHMGGYVRGRINQRLTTYAAAGPMLMYGAHEVEEQYLDGSAINIEEGEQLVSQDDSSAVNLGYYARAGIDFEIRKNQYLGAGFRYMASELDFDKTIGNLDIEGPQFVFTFSKKM